MADPKQDPKPTETDVQNKPEEEKNLDADGRERQPPDHTDRK
jgi:hypothetical protein